MINVCPSTNPCPEDKLIDYVKKLQNIGVEILHCDVMDGEFVSSKCLSIDLIKEITRNSLLILDVHLMIASPSLKLKEYLNLPVSYITVHYEAFKNKSDLIKVIKDIHKAGKLAGISIKPKTNVKDILEYLPLIDLILIMSVEPGKSGQKFMPEALDKIKTLNKFKKDNKLNLQIEVDGGINLDNAKSVVEAGAEMLVMGNAFYNAENKKELLNKVQSL